jgi:hypothetical protein
MVKLLNMFILEIMPLTKSIRTEHLSYFSTKDVEIGSIVIIELRKKLVRGIVLNKKDGLENKEELKSQRFSLKKIRGYFIKCNSTKAIYISMSKICRIFCNLNWCNY